MPESVRAAKYFANLLPQRIDRKKSEITLWKHALLRGKLATGVNEVITRRLQRAVQGRFWLHGVYLMGFAIYYVAFFGRVASCSTSNRRNCQTDNNNSSSSSSSSSKQAAAAASKQQQQQQKQQQHQHKQQQLHRKPTAFRKLLRSCKVPEYLLLDRKYLQAWKPVHK